MRNFLFGVMATITALAVYGFFQKIETTIPKKEWIIAPRFLTLQKGVTKEQAREWMEKEYLPLYRYYSGWNAELGEPTGSGKWGKSDNTAKEKGDFVLIYFFDSPRTRDHYFPPNGPWSEEIQKVLAEHKSTWDDLFGKYFIQDKYQNEEYTMFATAKK
ncbi:hypothetical protein GCM10023189_27320 [Nibrella saemangeumensis]|uniref:Uncharacterized protein n=1 Tax=Nibrella saemangeumensis TaxID=1084526 RepID=A0ABP8MZ09_9BACT